MTDHRNDEIVLEIRDDGRGMSPDELEHAFEPKFRVAGNRVSTKWGLFVARSIIAEHGGTIELESEPARGTTARVVLPVASGLV